ncbi:integrase/recombinase xerD homolog [Mytilus edulis]|uniref:integrase/recombinase xerD homolog n=1 Tax=Mytilus edulis TaxID=6550 RepID=UPI0039EE7A53
MGGIPSTNIWTILLLTMLKMLQSYALPFSELTVNVQLTSLIAEVVAEEVSMLENFFVASAKNLDPEMTTTVNKTTPSSSTTTDCAFTAKDQDTLPVSVPSKHVPSVVPSQHQPLLQVLHPCLNEKDSATWREISQFANSNQQFTGCEKSIFNIVRSSKAISTNKKYDVYFKKFKEWCMTHKVIPLPASVSSVAVYISGLVQQSVSESVLLAHFYSIKWYHDFNLVCNPCEDKLIQMMIEGAKRILSKPVLKKEPITADHLQKIVDKIGSDRAHLPNVRICAMMLVGYAGFLRYSEIANLKMCNIKFFDTYVSLNIETGKTDVYRRGNNVIISKTNLPTCPVVWLLTYINLAKLALDSNQYVFRSVRFFKSVNSYKLAEVNRPLSYTRARELLLGTLTAIGLDCKLFCLHSLRSGGATAAARNDVPDRLIKEHGRWRTDFAKDGYIKDSVKKQLTVSSNLGI